MAYTVSKSVVKKIWKTAFTATSRSFLDNESGALPNLSEICICIFRMVGGRVYIRKSMSFRSLFGLAIEQYYDRHTFLFIFRDKEFTKKPSR
jgi:hypothetical protein